jgi:hypothetical protein
MSSPDVGTLQILMTSTDDGVNTLGGFGQYTVFLSGTYHLKLINIQINASDMEQVVRPLQIAIDNIQNFFGTQYPTLLYPVLTQDILGDIVIEMNANLQSVMRVQIREIDQTPMSDFTYAVLTFRYERC